MAIEIESVNPNCPVCGGEVKVREDGGYYCPYCRKRFVVKKPETQSGAPVAGVPQPPVMEPVRSVGLSPKQIFAQSVNSVALIEAGQSCGSGFCVGTGSTIITNAHVIDSAWNSGARNVTVVINDKRYNGALISRGSADGMDLAMIQLQNGSAVPLTVCPEHVSVGDDVYALGNSMGDGMSFVHGMISDDERYYNKEIPDGILCDISTNPGNSGGPLLNEKGELIGVCVAQRVDNEGAKSVAGMRYFIPVKYVLSFIAGGGSSSRGGDSFGGGNIRSER